MEYARFDQIDLPNLTVTEANPAHWLAFRRFTSDQVVAFNRAQTEILRAHTDAPITHNYMGRITDFDHFRVGEDSAALHSRVIRIFRRFTMISIAQWARAAGG